MGDKNAAASFPNDRHELRDAATPFFPVLWLSGVRNGDINERLVATSAWQSLFTKTSQQTWLNRPSSSSVTRTFGSTCMSATLRAGNTVVARKMIPTNLLLLSRALWWEIDSTDLISQRNSISMKQSDFSFCHNSITKIFPSIPLFSSLLFIFF